MVGIKEETKFLKNLYPKPPEFAEPDEELVVRAILSVTEAISQRNSSNEFGLYTITSWRNQGSNSPNQPILRRRQQVLLPWRMNKSDQNELILIHACMVAEDAQDTRDDASAQLRLELTFHNFSSYHLNSHAARNGEAQLFRQFLINRDWFGSDPDPPSVINAKLKVSSRPTADGHHLLVVLVAWAIALNLRTVANLPRLGNQPGIQRDKAYGIAVINDAARGKATPAHLLAALVKLKIVDAEFDQDWGQDLFDNTVNLSDGALDTHYTAISTSIAPPVGGNDGSESEEDGQVDASQSNGQGGGSPDPPPHATQVIPPNRTDQQAGQEDECAKCDVADHCLGASGQGEDCSKCPVDNHCCSRCPHFSHCVPETLPKASRGDLYNWSIHKFRSDFRHTKISMQAKDNRQALEWIRIRDRVHLEEFDVIRAVLAVTEAISLNGRNKKFGLYTRLQNDNAKFERPTSPSDPISFDIARRRADVILPICMQNQKPRAEERLRKSTGYEAHFVLAYIKREESQNTWSAEIFDSSPQCLPRQRVKHHIRNFLQRTRWWANNDHGMPEGIFQWPNVQQQASDWECGVHTILTGWAKALDLPLNPAPKLDCLHRAIEIILHACYGEVDCETICQFLHFVRWVKEGSTPPPDRIFKKTCPVAAQAELGAHHSDIWLYEELLVEELGDQSYARECIDCKNPLHCPKTSSQSPRNVPGNGTQAAQALYRADMRRSSSARFALYRRDVLSKKRRNGERIESTRRRKKRRT